MTIIAAVTQAMFNNLARDQEHIYVNFSILKFSSGEKSRSAVAEATKILTIAKEFFSAE